MIRSLTSASRFETNVKVSKKTNVKAKFDSAVASFLNFGDRVMASLIGGQNEAALSYAA